MSEDVNRHYGSRPFINPGLERTNIKSEVLGVDIGEDGLETCIVSYLRQRGATDGGKDDLAEPGTQLNKLQRQIDGCRAVSDQHAVLATYLLADQVFDCLHWYHARCPPSPVALPAS